MASCIIGIRHRVKATAAGEARPTQVAILEAGRIRTLTLPDDQAELDFVLGHFEGEEGFKRGDMVAMVLGGSGDKLAYALSRRAEEIGGSVLRIPPFHLKAFRPQEKDDDCLNLARLAYDRPELFYVTGPRDRQLIRLREALAARIETMKARIGCEQRLRQQFIGRVFCSPEGKYPEGDIEVAYDHERSNSVILTSLLIEEKQREKELNSAVEALEVYQQLFKPIMGVGPLIASRIIASILDIRRFETDAKLKAFCGVHVLPDGRFPRQRRGGVANWHPDARQALYLLTEQFNRRPDSEWGKRLREIKVELRRRHPEPVTVKSENGEGKAVKRYTDGHIHKMALWRTATKFVEWLHREWWSLEKAQARPEERVA